MQFITSLIGGSGNDWLKALFALGIVIVLIVLGVWLLKLLFNASSSVGRGRNKRLSVVDSLSIDPKRHLLIIRRDNVEHVILVGGPQDVVIETGIAVDEAAASQPSRRPVPMVAARKPMPGKVAPTPVVAPAKPLPAAPATVADKLREMGQPTDKKAHLSLRHTGLLRPVNETEPVVSPEISVSRAVDDTDSVKEERARRQIEGTDLVEGNSEANRN